jgi:MOSC domain-containing protein YiiM
MKDIPGKVLIITSNHFPQDTILKNVALRLLNEGKRVVICEYTRPIEKEAKITEEIEGIIIYRAIPITWVNNLKKNLGDARKFWIVNKFFRTLRKLQQFLSKIKLFAFSCFIALKNGFDLIVVPAKSHIRMARFYGLFGKKTKVLQTLHGENKEHDDKPSGKLEALWIKPERKQPMFPKHKVTLVKGVGIKNNVAGKKRQVTIIQQESWNNLMNELGLSLDPSTRRANLMISGLDLRNQKHRVLRIGSCKLMVIDETKPCAQMDEAWDGLCAAMVNNWVGGSFAKVLVDGDIAIGDKVIWED